MSTDTAYKPFEADVLADLVPGGYVASAILILAGALLTALLAQVTVPMTPVPMTGQTLAVGLVGATLGARRGAASIALYVVLGFIFPVYAGGTSGIATLWSADGGYLWGFILAAATIGAFAERRGDRRLVTAFAAFVTAQLLIFIPGVVVLHAVIGGSWGLAIHSGFTVFIAGGLVKAAVGAIVLPSAWHFARRVDRR